MARLVRAIHVFAGPEERKTWMARIKRVITLMVILGEDEASPPHTPIRYSTTSFASNTSDTIIVASASTNQTPNTLFFSTTGQRRM